MRHEKNSKIYLESVIIIAFMEKTPDEIYNFYKNLSENSRAQASFELYNKDKKRGIYELYHNDDSKFRNENVLLDTSASINLLLISICDKFNISDLKNSTVTLQFADRSIKHPKDDFDDLDIIDDCVLKELEEIKNINLGEKKEEDHLNLELKPLPSSLKYMFLEENNSFPIIIVADLSDEQEEELLDIANGLVLHKWCQKNQGPRL
ncbi:unnamed protein product [Spirodela intermedia]|uniref:Uncharacterized protein n=2 Tax=Spirodela intermedia TaxID=51605 RepID=A0A7I8KC30_SPIIN|nr:unnamed protein product [Spirodela intermedia]CAA6658546.1 unnamed protein product [Spirodela intermedia]CAA7394816.1 unnamed protein product [Spirodela intermedia]